MPQLHANHTPEPDQADRLVDPSQREAPDPATASAAPSSGLLGRRLRQGFATPHDILRLQRLVGNRAVGTLLAGPAARPPIPVRLQSPPIIARSWDVGALISSNRPVYDELVRMMKKKDISEARQLLRSLAVNTASPQELLGLLKDVPDATGLNQALKVAGDVAKLKALGKAFPVPARNIVLLASTAGDYQTLIDLAPLVTPAQTLHGELMKSGKTDRAKNLKAAIDLAGSYAELLKLKPLSDDNVELLTLLRRIGHAKALTFVPIAESAATISALLKDTDVDMLHRVMTTNPKADYATLHRLILKAKVTTGAKVDPMGIRFTQDTCTNQGNGYTVHGNIDRLKSHAAWDIPGDPIRVFQKTPDMNDWGPTYGDYGVADPANLEDDQIYSLDNRRLVAYQRAGRQIPQPAFVPISTVKRESWKFTTKTKGQTIRII